MPTSLDTLIKEKLCHVIYVIYDPLNYYDYYNKLRTVTVEASWDSVLEIDYAGTRIKKVNKSETK